MVKTFIIISFFATFSIAQAQNSLLPAKYYSYPKAFNSIEQLNSFTYTLRECDFIDDSLLEQIKLMAQQKKLKCYLDILTQCKDSKIFYNTPGLTDFKKDFLNKTNQIRKSEPLKMLDSMWYEYFRDTLNQVPNVRQYSGFKLCMRSGDLVVKERIYIPINNAGQFYANHYYRTFEEFITKALNKFLSIIQSPKRIGVYANPLLFHPVTGKMEDQDGIAFVFFNEAQVTFYKSKSFWIANYKFRLFYTHFDNYNTNGKKLKDIEDIKASNLMWYYDEPTKRSLIRIMNETYFENLHKMLYESRVNNSLIQQSWGEYPDVYKNFISYLSENTGNKIQATVVYDSYPTCKTDSFLFKVEINKKTMSCKFPCGKSVSVSFLKFLSSVAKEAVPERQMYLASHDETNLFYVFLKETEKEYILEHKMFYLYDLDKMK